MMKAARIAAKYLPCECDAEEWFEKPHIASCPALKQEALAAEIHAALSPSCVALEHRGKIK